MTEQEAAMELIDVLVRRAKVRVTFGTMRALTQTLEHLDGTARMAAEEKIKEALRGIPNL